MRRMRGMYDKIGIDFKCSKVMDKWKSVKTTSFGQCFSAAWPSKKTHPKYVKTFVKKIEMTWKTPARFTEILKQLDTQPAAVQDAFKKANVDIHSRFV